MKIKSFQGGYDDNLCYLIWCEHTKIAAVIDPSVEPKSIFNYIKTKELILDKILITHTHHDHIQYLGDFSDKYPESVVYVSKETTLINKTFIEIEHNDVVTIGENLIHVLSTPGHYRDSICYWSKDKNLIFTGDTVFVGRTGRTIGTGSDIVRLYDSIYNIILKLPIDTMIYPGHHYGFTKAITIKDNIKSSSFFKCNGLDEFILVMKNFEQNRKNS